MKIIYIIYNDWTKRQRSELLKAGFNVEDGFDRVEIEENERNRSILNLIDKWKLDRSSYGTLFEKSDFKDKELFAYEGNWNNGYPQPEGDFGYLNITYDLSDYCKDCGIGKVQIAPFQIKRAPSLEKKKLFDLFWVNDEIFTSRDVYEGLFKKLGIEAWPVIHFKTGKILANTVQLKITQVDVPVNTDGIDFETCPVCNRKKYTPKTKGFPPNFRSTPPHLPLFKGMEDYGAGGDAHKRIYLTKDLYEEFNQFSIKPYLWPVQPI